MKVYGKNVLNEVLSNPQKIKKLYMTSNMKDERIMQSIRKNKIQFESVSRETMDRMVKGNHQGIMAIVDKSDMDNAKVDLSQDFYLILNDVQDPGNIGTIVRTADSLNIKQIIVSNKTADVYNPKVVRSTMGAIFRVKVIMVDDLVKEIKNLQNNGIKVYSTDLNTDESIYTVNYEKSAVVIGNEANGVSKEVIEASDGSIKIPMIGKTESLNAAVATSVLLYEVYRDKLKNK